MLRRCCSLLLTLAVLLLDLPLASPSFAGELIVDNPDAGVQVKGTWTSTSTTSGAQGKDYLYRVPGDGSSMVTWPFPNSAPAGKYDVFARWTSGPNRATNATYQIVSNA